MNRSIAVPFSLCLLALLDAAFAGFRGAVGRDARLVNHRFNVRASTQGIGVGIVGLVWIAAATVPWLASVSTRTERFATLLDAGATMLAVYIPMAVLNLVAIGAYLVSGNHEVRAVAMTVVLGPFTLLRPLVICAGATAAFVRTGSMIVALGAVTAAVASLAVGSVVGWWHRSPST